MKPSRLSDTEVRYSRANSDAVVTTLGEVDIESVVHGCPVRRVRSYAGARHYSGLYWSSTTAGHVSYESRMELDRLLVADFDSDVEWMATRPMWLSGRDGTGRRRHVPDLLLRLRGGRYLLADVKPERFTARPEVTAVFDWTSRLCGHRGWGYQVWTGCDPTLLANLRFLAVGRRREFLDPAALSVLRQVTASGMTFGEIAIAAGAAGAPAASIRSALLGLLWAGEWGVDLLRPLSLTSVITQPVAA